MSQKYRQRGYQDKDREVRPRDRGPREKPEFKQVERQTREQVLRCHRCGERVEIREDLTREDTCRSCKSDIWCCVNCLWFDPGAHWECRKPIPEVVRPKDRRNECDWFQPRLVQDLVGRKSGPEPGQSDARRAFDALFKK